MIKKKKVRGPIRSYVRAAGDSIIEDSRARLRTRRAQALMTTALTIASLLAPAKWKYLSHSSSLFLQYTIILSGKKHKESVQLPLSIGCLARPCLRLPTIRIYSLTAAKQGSTREYRCETRRVQPVGSFSRKLCNETRRIRRWKLLRSCSKNPSIVIGSWAKD